MKNIIFRHFFNNFLVFFFLFWVSTALIVWVIQAVNFLDFVTEDGHGFIVYFFYTLLSLPKIFSKILPFVFFIALFLTLVEYEETNELIIFWLTGINKITFINHLTKISLIFFIIQLLLTTMLVPYSQDKGRSYIRSSNIDFFPSIIKPRTFVDTVSNLTIFIDKKNLNGEMVNIFLKDQINENSSQTIYAKKGFIKHNNNNFALMLFDGKIIKKSKNNVNVFNFKKTEINLSQFHTKTTTFPKMQERSSLTLIQCSFDKKKTFEFFLKINFMCDGAGKLKSKEELYKRFFLPIYIPLVCLLASLLIIFSKNNNSYSKNKYSLFFLGFITLIISEITIRYSVYNTFITYLFFTIPFILYLLIYLYIFKNLTTKIINDH